MFRRTFLKLTTGFLSSATLGKFALAASPSERDGSISFFVAGARYHQPPADLAEGDPVRLVAARHRGERCYEIHAGDRKIGYAPKNIVAALDRAVPPLEGRLSAVNLGAVPWKRYRITL